MMVGVNTLELNEATIIQVVQYWLNAQLVNNAPVVTSVTMNSGVVTKVFSVQVESQVRP